MNDGAAEAMLRGAVGVGLIVVGGLLVISVPVVLVRSCVPRGWLRARERFG